MKTTFFSLFTWVVFVLSVFQLSASPNKRMLHASFRTKEPAASIVKPGSSAMETSLADTLCCPPDSLKIVSNNFPIFCVSWHVASDSSCKKPYGFEIQWRPYPGSGSWTGAIQTYTSGSTVSFCARVDSCRAYAWRVRTICDTLNGGHYSDWVYGNKIGMICPLAKTSENDLDTDAGMKKPEAIKPKQQE